MKVNVKFTSFLRHSLAVGDATIAQALCLIRNRSCEDLSVDDIAAAVSLSRRTFERRFSRSVGRSPNAEIQRARLERVQDLLRTTEWNLSTVAEHTGFAHPEYMSTIFKRKLGETPGQYRRRHRDGQRDAAAS